MADPSFSGDPPAQSFTSTNSAQAGQVQPQFTTAGTVYNPSANLPIQPPVRRGRTLRWPPQSQAELASIPKSLLRSLPLDDVLPQSPPTTASSLKRYSPLQQNTYKASTPRADVDQTSEFGSIFRSSAMSATTSRLPLASHPPPGFRMAVSLFDQHKRNHGAIGEGRYDAVDDGHDDGHSENVEDNRHEADRYEAAPQNRSALAKFNTKTLTNLASYPNPMQQSAQEALAAARPSSVVSNSQDSGISQPARGMSDLQNVASSDPFRFAQPSAGDKPSIGVIGAPVRPIPTAPRAFLDPIPRGSATQGLASGKSHFTMLSSGPGAPQPLTAGPPGQRQYKSSTLDSTLSAMQDKSQKLAQLDLPTSDQFDSSRGPSPVQSRGLNPLRPTFTPAALRMQEAAHERTENGNSVIGPTTVAPKPKPPPVTTNSQLLRENSKPVAECAGSSTSWMLSLLRDGCDIESRELSLPVNFRSSKDIRDTLPPEALRKYYPQGFPRDYVSRPRPSEQMWLNASDPTIPLSRFEKSNEVLEWESSVVEQAFYAGTHDFGRSTKYFSREVERRRLDEKLGMAGQSKNQSIGIPFHSAGMGKPNFQPVTAEQAFSIPTSEDTNVLLNLAFKSVLNYAEDQGINRDPRIFSRAPHSVISDSDDSHRNFWRESSQETTAKVTLTKRHMTPSTDMKETNMKENAVFAIGSTASGGNGHGLNRGGQSSSGNTGLGVYDDSSIGISGLLNGAPARINFGEPAVGASRLPYGGDTLLNFGGLSFRSPETVSTESDYEFSAFTNPVKGTFGKGPSRTD